MTSPTDDRLRRRFEYEADADSVAAARRDASQFVMAHLGSPDGEDERLPLLVERLAVVVSELSSNAVEAVPGRRFRVEIAVSIVANGPAPTVACAVTCPRSGTEPAIPTAGPDPLAERGRGLAIVEALSDRCRIETTPDELTVTAELDMTA